MIIDGILLVLSGLLNILLSPLEVINISIDFLNSIPFVMQFFEIIAYVLPWGNFVPLFILVVGIIGFKIIISILKTIWDILPVV